MAAGQRVGQLEDEGCGRGGILLKVPGGTHPTPSLGPMEEGDKVTSLDQATFPVDPNFLLTHSNVSMTSSQTTPVGLRQSANGQVYSSV